MLSVAIIDVLGLPFDGDTLNRRGLGGSESAVILMSRELASLGFKVQVFNDCVANDCSPGLYDGVLYRQLHEIEHEDGFDIYIGMRSVAPFAPAHLREEFKTFSKGVPNFERAHKGSKYKVLWMHDTFCDGDAGIEELVVSGAIDKIFTLSDWHTSYAMNNHHGPKMRNFEVLKPHVWQTRNGIVPYSDWTDISQKDPNLFVHNSSITKGLQNLLNQVWPEVKRRLPEARLIVIGGFYRMRDDLEPDDNEKVWRQYYEQYHGTLDIEFTGIIRQEEIADILKQSSFMIYPAAFPETFGISALESLLYNTPLITNRFGALEETAIDSACYKMNYAITPNNLFPWIPNEEQVARFVDLVEYAYTNKYLLQQKQYACNIVKDFCTWAHVALQWKQHFYKVFQLYLSIEEYREVQRINDKTAKVFNRHYRTPEMLGVLPKTFEKHIDIIVATYNSEEYISRCIESIATQDYDDYSVYIINDASNDLTSQVVTAKLDSLPTTISSKFTLINNSSNVGAVCNQVTTIKKYCKNDSVVMIVDGDDWLAPNPNIFNMYNRLFIDNAEYCYGSCWSVVDNIPLISQPYPPEIKEARDYRQHKFNWNMPYTHLRVFKAHLLRGLDDSLFKDDNGEWYRAGGDNATFYNLIEQADPKNVHCISEIVYMYNDTSPINDYKISGEEQTRNAEEILNRPKVTTSEFLPDGGKKILVTVCTSGGISKETYQSIFNLEAPKDYSLELRVFESPDIIEAKNQARKASLDYDYWFNVHPKIVLPRNSLVKLLSNKKVVCSGLYMEKTSEKHIQAYELENSTYSSMPLYKIMSGPNPRQVYACGTGCILIDSNFLENKPFSYEPSKEGVCPVDLYFTKNLEQNIFVDYTVKCGLSHNGEVLEIGRVSDKENAEKYLEYLSWWPFRDEDIEYLKHIRDNLNYYPKVIYDIGAATTMWTKVVDDIWPDSEKILFEANDYMEALIKKTGYKYHLGVLSDESNKEVDFYQSIEEPGGSSYYREVGHPNSKRIFTEESKVKKTTKTLDDVVYYNNYPLPDFVKIDVQGAELDILKGATYSLSVCKHLIIECQHVEYNEGAPIKEEVFEYLNSMGFSLKHSLTPSEWDGDYHFIKE